MATCSTNKDTETHSTEIEKKDKVQADSISGELVHDLVGSSTSQPKRKRGRQAKGKQKAAVSSSGTGSAPVTGSESAGTIDPELVDKPVSGRGRKKNKGSTDASTSEVSSSTKMLKRMLQSELPSDPFSPTPGAKSSLPPNPATSNPPPDQNPEEEQEKDSGPVERKEQGNVEGERQKRRKGDSEEVGTPTKSSGRKKPGRLPRSLSEGEKESPAKRIKLDSDAERLPGANKFKICNHCGMAADKAKAKKCQHCKKFFYPHWAQRCKIPPCPNCHFSRRYRHLEPVPSECEKCGFKLPADLMEASTSASIDDADGQESVGTSSTSLQDTPEPSELDPMEMQAGGIETVDDTPTEVEGEREKELVDVDRKKGKTKSGGEQVERGNKAKNQGKNVGAKEGTSTGSSTSKEGSWGLIVTSATTRSGRAYKQSLTPARGDLLEETSGASTGGGVHSSSPTKQDTTDICSVSSPPVEQEHVSSSSSSDTSCLEPEKKTAVVPTAMKEDLTLASSESPALEDSLNESDTGMQALPAQMEPLLMSKEVAKDVDASGEQCSALTTEVPPFQVSMDPPSPESVGPQSHESIDDESVNPQSHEPVDSHRSVDPQSHGSVDPQSHESMDPQSHRSVAQSCGLVEPQSVESAVSQSQTLVPGDESETCAVAGNEAPVDLQSRNIVSTCDSYPVETATPQLCTSSLDDNADNMEKRTSSTHTGHPITAGTPFLHAVQKLAVQHVDTDPVFQYSTTDTAIKYTSSASAVQRTKVDTAVPSTSTGTSVQPEINDSVVSPSSGIIGAVELVTDTAVQADTDTVGKHTNTVVQCTVADSAVATDPIVQPPDTDSTVQTTITAPLVQSSVTDSSVTYTDTDTAVQCTTTTDQHPVGSHGINELHTVPDSDSAAAEDLSVQLTSPDASVQHTTSEQAVQHISSDTTVQPTASSPVFQQSIADSAVVPSSTDRDDVSDPTVQHSATVQCSRTEPAVQQTTDSAVTAAVPHTKSSLVSELTSQNGTTTDDNAAVLPSSKSTLAEITTKKENVPQGFSLSESSEESVTEGLSSTLDKYSSAKVASVESDEVTTAQDGMEEGDKSAEEPMEVTCGDSSSMSNEHKVEECLDTKDTDRCITLVSHSMEDGRQTELNKGSSESLSTTQNAPVASSERECVLGSLSSSTRHSEPGQPIPVTQSAVSLHPVVKNVPSFPVLHTEGSETHSLSTITSMQHTANSGTQSLPVLYTTNLLGPQQHSNEPLSQSSLSASVAATVVCSTVHTAGKPPHVEVKTSSLSADNTAHPVPAAAASDIHVCVNPLPIPCTSLSVGDGSLGSRFGGADVQCAVVDSGSVLFSENLPSQKQAKGKKGSAKSSKEGKTGSGRKKKQPKDPEEKDKAVKDKPAKPKKPRAKKSKTAAPAPDPTSAAITMLATSFGQVQQRKPPPLVPGQPPKHTFSQYFYSEEGSKSVGTTTQPSSEGSSGSATVPGDVEGSSDGTGGKGKSKRALFKSKDSQEPPVKKKKLANIAPSTPICSVSGSSTGLGAANLKAAAQLPPNVIQQLRQLATNLKISFPNLLSLLHSNVPLSSVKMVTSSGGTGSASSSSPLGLLPPPSSSLPPALFPPLTMSFQSLTAALSNMPMATTPMRLPGTQVTARTLLPTSQPPSANTGLPSPLSTSAPFSATHMSLSSLPTSHPFTFTQLGPPLTAEQMAANKDLLSSEASVGTQTAVSVAKAEMLKPAISAPSALSPQLLTLPNPPQLTSNLPSLSSISAVVSRDIKPMFQSGIPPPYLHSTPPPLTPHMPQVTSAPYSVPANINLAEQASSAVRIAVGAPNDTASTLSYLGLPRSSATPLSSVASLSSHKVEGQAMKLPSFPTPQVSSSPSLSPSPLPPPPHLLPQSGPKQPVSSQPIVVPARNGESNPATDTSPPLPGNPIIPSLLRPENNVKISVIATHAPTAGLPLSTATVHTPAHHPTGCEATALQAAKQKAIYTQTITLPKVCSKLQPTSAAGSDSAVNANLQVKYIL